MNDDRSYATDNGYYIGDDVQMRNGDITYIESIITKGHWTYLYIEDENHPDGFYYQKVPCSVVKLANGKVALDIRLTRIAR